MAKPETMGNFIGTVTGDNLDYSTTVPCKYCARVTRMTGTRMCNNCWELETRILADPATARIILEAVEKKESK